MRELYKFISMWNRPFWPLTSILRRTTDINTINNNFYAIRTTSVKFRLIVDETSIFKYDVFYYNL